MVSSRADDPKADAPPVGERAALPAKKKQYYDQQEYTLYDSVTKETDANKKLALLNTWKEKYADSDFKVERMQLFLTTYNQLGQAAKMIDTAKEILSIDPKDITALYWITLLIPKLDGTSPDTLDTAEKAANGLLAAEKPSAVKDEDWIKAKSQTDAIASSTLGWIAMQRKNNDVPEQNSKKSLKLEDHPPVFELTIQMLKGKTARVSYHQTYAHPTVPGGSSKESGGERNDKSVQLLFGEEELAHRVAKALQHAVELCGGGTPEELF